jgi:hypothetical protein
MEHASWCDKIIDNIRMTIDATGVLIIRVGEHVRVIISHGNNLLKVVGGLGQMMDRKRIGETSIQTKEWLGVDRGNLLIEAMGHIHNGIKTGACGGHDDLSPTSKELTILCLAFFLVWIHPHYSFITEDARACQSSRTATRQFIPIDGKVSKCGQTIIKAIVIKSVYDIRTQKIGVSHTYTESIQIVAMAAIKGLKILGMTITGKFFQFLHDREEIVGRKG